MGHPFREGDAVVCIKSFDSNKQIVGEKGVVLSTSDWCVLVQFYNNIGGHDGGGGFVHGLDGHCWEFYNNPKLYLSLVGDINFVNIYKSNAPYRNSDVIIHDGNPCVISRSNNIK